MKYVILKAVHKTATRVYPFIFPEYCTHSEVAKSMIHMIGFETGDIPDVLSAGFGGHGEGVFIVYNHGSESLKIKADKVALERDQRIFDMPDAMQGILL